MLRWRLSQTLHGLWRTAQGPEWVVTSTGRRNTGAKSLCWGMGEPPNAFAALRNGMHLLSYQIRTAASVHAAPLNPDSDRPIIARVFRQCGNLGYGQGQRSALTDKLFVIPPYSGAVSHPIGSITVAWITMPTMNHMTYPRARRTVDFTGTPSAGRLRDYKPLLRDIRTG